MSCPVLDKNVFFCQTVVTHLTHCAQPARPILQHSCALDPKLTRDTSRVLSWGDLCAWLESALQQLELKSSALPLSDAGAVSISVHISLPISEKSLFMSLLLHFPSEHPHHLSVNVRTLLEWAELGQDREGIISLPTWQWAATEIIGAVWKLSYFHEDVLRVQTVIRICIIILIFTCQCCHQWQERALLWK